MNILDVVEKLKTLKAAIQAGDIAAALDTAGDLAKMVAVLLGSFGVASEADFTVLDAALADLEACAAAPAVANTAAIDPGTIITIISLVKTLFDLFKKRR